MGDCYQSKFNGNIQVSVNVFDICRRHAGGDSASGDAISSSGVVLLLSFPLLSFPLLSARQVKPITASHS